MEETRALLDSLMGKDRNSDTASKRKPKFTDSDVCQYYLLEFCPHDLFPNTKSDLGECPNLHSDNLKFAFEKDADYEYYKSVYEENFIKILQRLVDQVDQRVIKGQQRLSQVTTPSLSEESQLRIQSMNERVSELLRQAEEAGADGKIDEATELSDRAIKLRAEIDLYREEAAKSAASKESLLRVCETCGAIQSVGDSITRFESHIAGKQHVGFERIRLALADLKSRAGERTATLRKGPRNRNSEISVEKKKEKSAHSRRDVDSDADNTGSRSRNSGYSKRSSTAENENRNHLRHPNNSGDGFNSHRNDERNHSVRSRERYLSSHRSADKHSSSRRHRSRSIDADEIKFRENNSHYRHHHRNRDVSTAAHDRRHFTSRHSSGRRSLSP